MTHVYWLEQRVSDVPVEDDWLSDRELRHLQDLRFTKRRTDWRLGRWTAKKALTDLCGFGSGRQSLARIEIRAAPSGVPEVFVDGDPASSTISLSHRDGLSACALASDQMALGCDLERIEPRSIAFIGDYFTEGEQELIASGNTDLLATLLWSAKESALKALHVGLTADTRSVVVSIEDDVLTFAAAGTSLWGRLRVQDSNHRILRGFWQAAGSFVRTMVADPPVREIVVMSSPQPATVSVRSD